MEDQNRELLQAIGQLFDTKLQTMSDRMDAKFDDVYARFDVIDKKFDDVYARFDTIDGKFEFVDRKFDSLSEKIVEMQIQTKENTEILKSLCHLAQVNSANHSAIQNSLDRTRSDILQMKDTIASMDATIQNVVNVTALNWADINRFKRTREA